MNSALMRIFMALLIHVAIAALAGGLIYLTGSGQSAVSDLVRMTYADRPAMIESVRSESVWQVIQWSFFSLAASWLFASVWLILAEGYKPTTPAEGAGRQGAWIGLLGATLSAMAAIGWSMVWRLDVAVDLATGMLTIGIAIVVVSVLLAYHLATAMTVKSTMRPSVPLSGALPSIVRGRA